MIHPMQWLEDFGKNVMNYSGVGWLIHHLQNRGNPDAVFIWIPKNAGTSVYKTLKKRGCLKAKKPERVKYRFSGKGLATFGHMDYHRLMKEGYVSRSYMNRAFKFCFSRNPYDRAISLYEYFKTSFGRPITFAQFIKKIHDEGVPSIGLFNSWKLSSCNPQKRWVENLELDFCGRFETLEDDFNRVLNHLDLPETELQHRNKSLRKRLSEYYDPDTKKRVEDFYREDFEYFGYPVEPADHFTNR